MDRKWHLCSLAQGPARSGRALPPALALSSSVARGEVVKDTRLRDFLVEHGDSLMKRGSSQNNGMLEVATPVRKKTCIIVCGMHRSGTSAAVTRVVNLLGADIACDLLPAVAPDALGMSASLPSRPNNAPIPIPAHRYEPARQLPDQSTTLRVDSSSTDDSRLRGALPRPDSCTSTCSDDLFDYFVGTARQCDRKRQTKYLCRL
jgi:hypothetical protein